MLTASKELVARVVAMQVLRHLAAIGDPAGLTPSGCRGVTYLASSC